MDDVELPLGLPPLPPGDDRVIDGGDRPGLRVGERDGLVRRADGMAAINPAMVRDRDGLTELERNFVQVLVWGRPGTGEAVEPGEAWLLAGGSGANPREVAGQALERPAVHKAYAAASLVRSQSIAGRKAVQALELALDRILEKLAKGSPLTRMDGVLLSAGLAMRAGKEPERVEVTHELVEPLQDRLQRAHRRAEQARQPPLFDARAEMVDGAPSTAAATEG